ncbi:PREDICTED: uncharacterized protein LOC108564028 [Nicrophorus vespilloides]|uniref:Uncharacterized protein LOC108564028 n=1 Tax=Nicrophorus vespilloides TaxID=110193 RepID=A0ABM1MUY7_NICVS|nr:PREDICTED: uncharacterized protein LOC108564028 [Nicrophorus vespilloides]
MASLAASTTTFSMLFRVMTNVLFVKLVSCRLESLPDDLSERQSLAECISKASDIYFLENEIITLSLATSTADYMKSPLVLDRLLLYELFNKTKWSILVKKPNQIIKVKSIHSIEYKKSDYYIIQIRTLQEVDQDLDHLKHHPSWNPHARFMIISVTYFNHRMSAVAAVIKKLWDLDILNGVILFSNNNRSTVFNVYSWFPFANGRCGDNFNQIQLITTCRFGIFDNDNDWFPEKIPHDLNACPFNVRTLVFPPFVMEPENNENGSCVFKNGLEIRLLDLVAEVANFTTKYSISGNLNDWGTIHVKDNTISSLLIQGKMDLGVGSMSATVDRHFELDWTGSYFLDALGFCVPHAEEKPQWKKLSGIMHGHVWMAIGASIIITIITTYSFSRRCTWSNEFTTYKTYFGASQKVLAIFLTNSINRLPKTINVRIIISVWIIVSFFLTTAYQTCLMSSLTKPDYEPQIKTISELLDADMELLFVQATKRYFDSEVSTEDSKEMLRRWKDCPSIDDCLQRTAYKRDSVVVASRLYTSYAESGYKSSDGLPLLYCFRHSIVTFPIVIYMRKGFPLRDRIDKIVDRINSAGFLQQWEKSLFARKKINSSEEFQYRQDVYLGLKCN